MRLKYTFWHLLLIVFLLPQVAKSQISAGGFPIQVLKEKSSILETTDLVVMPKLDNEKLRSQHNLDTDKLKPFVFAHTFDVALTLKNSGTWYNTTDMNVWQLRVKSADAYSLNFVFENFRIPTGAKLFLISNTTGEIKGAYTSENNSESRIFAIEPIAGEEILIQYEEPVNPEFQGAFTLTKISHDFVGITATSPRRPLGESGSCNVNANCDVANAYDNVRDAVCRIISIDQVFSGTMINNTAKDGTPYLLTANHCINTEYKAQVSVFLFNYEAPFCSYYNSPTIDGDVTNSLSGSTLVATFDSLDFTLVRLNKIPAGNFRVFLAGWNKSGTTPVSTASIHHPMGDVKKVAIDLDAPITKTYTTYLKNGFWNIVAWDYGVTEGGSSGGPLFDQNQRLVGSLTGGGATCLSRRNDYFAKFSLSWDYRSEQTKQLKAWLDPAKTNQTTIDGMYLNSGKTLCKATTNFLNNDTQAIMEIKNGISKKGYWSGTNSAGITEIAEQYKFAKNCEIHGVSLGIAKVKVANASLPANINVKVYQGATKPENMVYSEQFDTRKFVANAMNYITFSTPVKAVGNFYVSVDLTTLSSSDTLVVYMANRKSDYTNSFYLKNTSGWTTYNTQNLSGLGSALLTELVSCNVDDPLGIAPLSQLSGLKVFPNPLSGSAELKVITDKPIDCREDVRVFDLLGKEQDVVVSDYGPNEIGLRFTGKRPGVYFVRIETGGQQLVEKISYFP